MQRFVIHSLTSLAATTAITLLTNITPSYAFTPFDFTTNYSQSGSDPFDPTRDIQLNSLVFGSNTVNSFTYVSGVQSFGNDDTTTTPDDASLGPFSSDRGDNASGINGENPTDANLLASLANNNLNNIIDGEDDNNASLNLFFAQPTNRLFFFERGSNSDLMVNLINASGDLLGIEYKITRDLWRSAGYSIDTTEIIGAQDVGSHGLSYGGLIAGIRVSSKSDYNGADFKVVGGYVDDGTRHVPTPSLLLGLGVIALKNLKRRSIAA